MYKVFKIQTRQVRTVLFLEICENILLNELLRIILEFEYFEHFGYRIVISTSMRSSF